MVNDLDHFKSESNVILVNRFNSDILDDVHRNKMFKIILYKSKNK